MENGGDLFVARNQACTVAVYAGESPLSGKLAIGLQPDQMNCGVCCSSGTIGHSLSLGNADAVVVVAPSTAFELAGKIDGLSGVLIISGDRLGAWGDIELVQL